jgi:hypothetical protein
MNIIIHLQNTMRNGIIGLVILILDILAVIEIFKSNKDTTAKVLWILAVIIFPLLGLILYAIFGRGEKTTLTK